MLNKLVPAAAATLAVFLTQALPAAACGGLVAPKGAIRLDRATPLGAGHDGAAHYMTTSHHQATAQRLRWPGPRPHAPDSVPPGGPRTPPRPDRGAVDNR